ncbi:MAG: hypothetical protein M3P40_02815 [Actinomycetota bacterium]|nr:hypothetical protein [Actinomycetota bacterium]
MFNASVITVLVLAEALGYRRAKFGKPPRNPIRVVHSGFISCSIHIAFHALATVAPTTLTAIAFVFAGWTTFIIWWKWMARAPKPNWGEGDDSGGGPNGGGGGGSGGGGPSPGGGGLDFDWDAFEDEMNDYLDRDRELVGA